MRKAQRIRSKKGAIKDVKLFPTKRDLLKKLDIMSGVINTIDGRVKIIFQRSSSISTKLDIIFDEIQEQHDKSSFHFSKVRIENITIKGDIKKVNIDFLQQVTYTLEATDRKGNPAKVESVTWELTDPSIATLEVNPDNQLEATAKGISGVTGVTLVRATADVRFGEETLHKVAEDALNVTDPEAEIISLKASEATDQ